MLVALDHARGEEGRSTRLLLAFTNIASLPRIQVTSSDARRYYVIC